MHIGQIHPDRRTQLFRFIVFAVSMTLIVAVAPLAIGKLTKMGDRFWDGEITIHREGAAHLDDTGAQGRDGTYIRKKIRNVTDVTTIRACGADTLLTLLSVYSVERKLKDKTSKYSFTQPAETDCGPVPGSSRWDNQRIKKHPGSSHEEKETEVFFVYHGKDAISPAKMTSVTLQTISRNQYNLSVSTRGLVGHTINHFEESKNACDEMINRKEYYLVTGKVKDPTKRRIEGPKVSGEKGKRVIRDSFPPLILPAGFYVKTEGSENLLVGNTLISEKKSTVKGGYNEVERGSWNFKIMDLCEEVHRQLLKDLAWAEAYLHPDLQNVWTPLEGRDRIHAYEKNVNARAYRIYHGKDPVGDDFTTTDASVNPETGEIEDLDHIKDRLTGQCKPAVIYESIVEHEKVHVRQQRDSPDKFKSYDRSIFGRIEAEAYLVDIGVLMKWLEEHCREKYGLVEEKQRVERIEKMYSGQ